MVKENNLGVQKTMVSFITLSSLKFADALNCLFSQYKFEKNYFAPMSVFVPCQQRSGRHLSRHSPLSTQKMYGESTSSII